MRAWKPSHPLVAAVLGVRADVEAQLQETPVGCLRRECDHDEVPGVLAVLVCDDLHGRHRVVACDAERGTVDHPVRASLVDALVMESL
ncbi:MAG TPA: hypothetical protein VLF59_02165 [Candidatus Saccharimonadales bacterium]|nr:hypothetical protein [Candidatus Saccharimonadales bacterium]